jgi:hypothetical protein
VGVRRLGDAIGVPEPAAPDLAASDPSPDPALEGDPLDHRSPRERSRAPSGFAAYARLALPIAAAILGATLLLQPKAGFAGTLDTPTEVELKPARGAPLRLVNAPPSFKVDRSRAVFVHIDRSTIALELDAKSMRAKASARLEIEQPKDGYPIIDLVPDATDLKIDGASASPRLFKKVSDPDGATTTRIVAVPLKAGRHSIEVSYAWPLGAPELALGWLSQEERAKAPFDFQLAMNDYLSGGRGFLERYAPANFEFDQYPTRLDLTLKGCEGCKVFANGTITHLGDGAVSIAYPPYFNASSYFLAVVDPAGAQIREAVFHSKSGRDVPVTLIDTYPEGADEVMARILESLASGEELVGPYPHPSFIALRRTGDENAGMEYAGAATIGSSFAVRHEVYHSWFARGVMPADGDAGFIDEGLAGWMDQILPHKGDPGSDDDFFRPLPKTSPYQRHTRVNGGWAVGVMQRLDRVLAGEGGLLPRLPKLFERFDHKTITVGDFKAFLKETSSPSVHAAIDAVFVRASPVR